MIDRGAEEFGAGWVQEFEQTLSRLFGGSDDLRRAARAYAYFVIDLVRRQRRFEQERTYPAKSYEEAAAEVYHDERYMSDEYLPGLLLSHFLWPHHVRHARFFDSAFVPEMRRQPEPAFIEVGVGTGLYSRRLLQQVRDARGVGVDISSASLSFASEHVRAFGLEDRYEVESLDVMSRRMPRTEWLVCIEVLEHLEDPLAFLRRLRESLAERGRAFITAALNAAHVDHIYLYESSDEVLEHLREAGFALEQSFVAAAYPPATPDAPVPSVAAFIVT